MKKILLLTVTVMLTKALWASSNEAVIVSAIPDHSIENYFEYYKEINKDYRNALILEICSIYSHQLPLPQQNLKERIVNGQVKWVINSADPQLIRLPYLKNAVYIAPGDSIHIAFTNDEAVITGRNVEAFKLQYAIAEHEGRTAKPQSFYLDIKTVADYLNWNQYFDQELTFYNKLIGSYKNRIPDNLFDLIKNNVVKNIENQRLESYLLLHNYRLKNEKIFSVASMQKIADTTLNKPSAIWLRAQSNLAGSGDIGYFLQYARMRVWNKMGWNFEREDFNSREKMQMQYIREIDQLYKGLIRERLFQYVLADEIIKKFGYQHPFTKTLLRNYYKGDHFPAYQNWMKDFEKKAAVKYNFGQQEPERIKNPELQLSIRNDGPYVIYKGDTAQVNYIVNEKPVIESKIKSKTISLKVNTDQYPQTFTVQLKSAHQNEAAVYAQPDKQLAISDIEGNFDALRKLLQSNGVMGKDYSWTFGTGHLVCVGDFFDRGEQVTEVLWLIYSLEEKAKAAGGYVHFILGNHEILNLSNDQRYVKEKYKHNANLLEIPYRNLYGPNSELGKWLRTKNIVEKVGNVIYTHGGFGRAVNNMNWTLDQINNGVRPHLDNRDGFKQNKDQPELMALFSSTTSPFWYRGYYKSNDQMGIIDSTLQQFQASHIITGHTIVADTVSVWWNGKVCNLDTHHAAGKSEALLIEGDRFYRVNAEGDKVLLFLDDKKK